MHNRIKELVNELNKACKAYYVFDDPIMSDKEYDRLYDELEALEKESGFIISSSPTQKVKGQVLECFTKIKHTEPMLSAQKSKDINDIIKFMKNQVCVISWKLDGLTLVLRYNNGVFYQAITRGGGTEGEDVTHTVRTFTNIPLRIKYKGYLEIRGEGLVSIKDFERINEKLIAKGLEPYKSPRNLASGSVRNLDTNITKERNLFFIAFGIVKCDGELWNSKYAQLAWLEDQGFEVVYYKTVKEDNLEKWVNIFKEELNKLPYLTDGLIIEFEDVAYGKAQGATEHHTKNMFALKWNDDSFETKFRGVRLNTTRTGMVSITALYDQVDFDGAKNDRATLHNYTYFESLQLGIGDTILVYRANSVIPEVEDNFTRSGIFKIDMKCHSCNSEIIIKQPKETKFLFCSNDNCPSKFINKLVHYCSKDAMNIEGISEAGLEQFVNEGFIKCYEDIYKLQRFKNKIINLEGWGIRSYNKLIQAIEKSKTTKLYRLIYGLGIPQVGLNGSRNLCKHFDNDIIKIEYSNVEELMEVKDFGKITAKNIYDYLDNENNCQELYSILKYLTFTPEEEKEVINIPDNLFKGKLVYGTGTFANFKKNDLKSKLESLGAEFANGYSKSLDYLIVGSVKGSSKVDKALKDNIPVIYEDQFINMIGKV